MAKPDPLDAGRNADDTRQIRAYIEKTRAELGETIGALQERLSPDRIKEEVKEKLRHKASDAYVSAKDAVRKVTIRRAEGAMNTVSEKARGAGSSIVDTVRANPIPFALIGAGIGMLTLRRRRSDRETYYEGEREYPAGYSAGEREYLVEEESEFGAPAYGEEAGGVSMTEPQSSAGSKAREMREKAGRIAGRTREQVQHVSERARYRARRTGNDLRDTFRSNPLAVAAAVLAGGAAVGLALPSTRAEREYMGEARDRVVREAGSVARSTADKVKRVAEEAGRTAKQEAESQGLVSGSE